MQYQVKSGDNLSSIAQRYGVPISSISGYSSGNPNQIKIGEKLSFSSNPVKSQPTLPRPSFSSPLNNQPSATLMQKSSPLQPKFVSNTMPAPQRPLEIPKVEKPLSQPAIQPQPTQDWASQQVQNVNNHQVPNSNPMPSAEPPGLPSNPTSNQATTQAIRSGASAGLLEKARQYLGTQEYIGLCQAFVERATKGREGIYASAAEAWEKQQDKAQTDFSKIKPGDVIYFSPSESNNWYGHTGIYGGGNKFISATYNGIKELDLNDWMKSTGQKLLGFISEGEGGGTPAGWVQQKVEEVGSMVAPKAYADSGVSSPSYVQGTPNWVQPIIAKAAKRHNIPSIMLSALLKKESGFNPNARSPVGATGIAQFMPATAEELGIDPNDPEQAIDGAARYLRQQWDKFGKPDLALAAYNSGAGNVQSFGGIPPFKETKDYVKQIMEMAGSVHATAYDPMLKLALGGQTKSPSASFR